MDLVLIESLDYYIDKYNVNDDFIVSDGTPGTVSCNAENMNILLNDNLHPFGHGYCLGMSLLNITIE
jgi:hypothetical protein